MSKLTLYNGIKTDLEAITGVKHVALWNNQIEHERQEIPFLYPAIFIEFMPSNYRDKGRAATSQEYDMNVRLRICFEEYKQTDVEILTLVDSVWQKMHKKQYGTFGQLLRRNEEQDYDHPNIQQYIQDYATLGNENLIDTDITHTVTLNINSTTIAAPSLDGIGAMDVGTTFIVR